MSFLYIFDLLGTIVFAISGVLLAGKMRMDPFGVVVLATVTAVGGGTMRDAILGALPVFWIKDPIYLYIIFSTALISMFFIHFITRINRQILPILDAIGLAFFVGIGVNKALSFGTGPLVAVVMGIITGVGGGIIRDVLAREIPMVLQKEIYATACLAGATVHVGLYYGGVGNQTSMFCGLCITLGIRLFAIHYQLRLPTFVID